MSEHWTTEASEVLIEDRWIHLQSSVCGRRRGRCSIPITC